MQEALEPKVWLVEGAAKREVVRRMFARIAPRYDLLNRLLSFNLDRKWRAMCVEMVKLRPGDAALDLCSGTGDFLLALRKAVGRSGSVVGLDFCLPMLRRAAPKVDAFLALADALSLPVATSAFDAVTIGWGLRNLVDIDAGLREAYRVLKPGGWLVSIDTARPKNRLVSAVCAPTLRLVAPLLGHLAGDRLAYRYLQESTLRYRTPEQLDRSLEAAGFQRVQHRRLFLGNVCIHYGRKP